MFSFVILHYKNLSDTLNCILSIKKLKEKDIRIIVVDNHSLTKEEENILKKKCDDLILMDENVGFAKANNMGCKIAISKYHPHYLIVINNDTLIEQKDFCKRIQECDKKYQFDILGPKILSNNANSVNPFYAYSTLEEVEKQMNYSKKLIRIYQSKILRNLLSIGMKLKRILIKRKELKNGEDLSLGVALHGCALIFSKKYYQKYEDIFYPHTFLYHEEEFLYQRILKDKLISVYDPELEIFHLEGSSLNTLFSNNTYEKLIFRNSEIIKSLTLLEKEMKGSKK